MNTLKRTAAVLLAGTMLLPAFACSGNDSSKNEQSGNSSSSEAKNNSSADNSSNADSKNDNNSNADSKNDNSKADNPLPIDEKALVTDANGAPNYALHFDDNVKVQNDEDAANAIVTTLRGEDGEIYVPRTDINGTTVTQEDGNPVTDVYTGTTLASEYAEKTYTPKFRNYMAFWLDISKRDNYVFDGDLLEYDLRIAEDAPDGKYPIEFTLTDMSDYYGKGVGTIDTIPGFVCVNREAPEQKVELSDNLTLTVESVSVKPGDKARLKMKIANNKGIAGFRIMIRYDSNVITIKKAGAGGELAESASLTAHPIDEE